jgi:hypothetical protein
MIEVAQPYGPGTSYRIIINGKLLCTVEEVVTREHGFFGPDWPATKARAEHIAEALRHYQQSQEAEVTP